MAGDVRRIDLLRRTVGSDSAAGTRYAHSYIGMGLTPINIDEMAKCATSARTAVPTTADSRSSPCPHTAKWRILSVALKAATRGLGPQPTARHYRYTTLKPTPMQLDGEVIAVEAATAMSVDIAAGALATVG